MPEIIPAVSVVIPIYNCGEMLEKCLRTIRGQSFKDIEVIIVNNGSTDGSDEVARRFAEEDERFRVVDFEHGSAGEARNYGISLSRGEYITFVDGDDRLSKWCIEKLYHGAKDNDADISVCGFAYFFQNKNGIKKSFRMSDKVLSSESALKLLLGDMKLRFYLWGKLWRKTLFTDNNIRIPDMYYEDAAVTPQLFYFANKVVLVDHYGYYYTRAFSRYTEVSMSADRINDYINTIPIMRLFFEEQGCYQKFKKHLNMHIFHVYFAVPSMVKQCGSDNKKSASDNIRDARAKVRLCMKVSYERLKKLDLSKPVVE